MRNCQSVSDSRSRQAGRRDMGSCRVRTILRPPVLRKDSQPMVTTKETKVVPPFPQPERGDFFGKFIGLERREPPGNHDSLCQ